MPQATVKGILIELLNHNQQRAGFKISQQIAMFLRAFIKAENESLG